MFVALTVAGGAIGIVKGSRRFGSNLPEGDSPLAHRLATGGLAALLATLFTLFFFNGLHFDHSRTVQGTWLAILAPLLFMDTIKWADPNRKERVSFWDTVFLAGLFGYIVAMVFDGHTMIGVFTPAGICLATQLLATWTPVADAPSASAKPGSKSPFDVFRGGSSSTTVTGAATSTTQPSSWGAIPPVSSTKQVDSDPRVPRFVRIIWLVLTLLTFALGLTLIIASGFAHPRDFASVLCGGLGCISGFVIFLVQACRSRFTGWWRYLLKPLLMILCLVPIFWAIAALGTPGEVRPDDAPIAIFAIVFPTVLIITALAIPGPRRRRTKVETPPQTDEPIPTAAPPSPAPAAPVAPAANPATSADEHPRADWTWQQWVNYGLNAQRRRQLRQQRDWWRWQRHRLRMRNRYGRRGSGESRLPSPFTLLAMILLPLAVVLALTVALNVPEALSVGLPDRNFTHDLSTNVFSGYPDWPALLLRLDRAAATLLLLLGIAAMTLGRRTSGATHIFRGLFGIGALVTAIALLGKAFYLATWSQIADELTTHHAVAAVARFLDGFDRAPLILAGVFFILSQVLLAWPPRRQKPQEAAAAPPSKSNSNAPSTSTKPTEAAV
jgi:hypothetical protein